MLDLSVETHIKTLYHVVESIRLDFSFTRFNKQRKKFAIACTKYIIRSLQETIKIDNKWLKQILNKNPERTLKVDQLKESVKQNYTWQKEFETFLEEIKRYNPKEDGRYFRDDFPLGYVGMLEHFHIKH